MWRIERPTHSTQETFRACLSGVDNEELKARLERIQLTVVRESEVYSTAAHAGQFHTLARQKCIDDCVTTDEMSELYSRHFARQYSAGRSIYDELKAAAPNGRCPLCGHGLVSTLDHFLPKFFYPGLSLTPLNLVPACTDCNKNKGRRFPRSASEATLHPYFDNVERESWLIARVLEEKPTAMAFSVRIVPTWSKSTQARVEKHFRDLKLWRLYSANAADELLNIRDSLRRISGAGAAQAMRAHLQEEARSRAANRINSWQTAMYTALAASEWFCAGQWLD